MTELSETYRCSLTTPSQRGGWRARLAHHLRATAQRLDGAAAIRLDSHCFPPLPSDEVKTCLRLGAEHGEALLDYCAREAAVERLMARTHPELFMEWGDKA